VSLNLLSIKPLFDSVTCSRITIDNCSCILHYNAFTISYSTPFFFHFSLLRSFATHSQNLLHKPRSSPISNLQSPLSVCFHALNACILVHLSIILYNAAARTMITAPDAKFPAIFIAVEYLRSTMPCTTAKPNNMMLPIKTKRTTRVVIPMTK